MSELKDCPFCGSDEIEDEFDAGSAVVPAWCARCGADGPVRGSEPGVDWNTRAAPDPAAAALQAEVERLKATLVKIHDVLFAPSWADEHLLRQLVWIGLGIGLPDPPKD
jgi:hypothetical protein